MIFTRNLQRIAGAPVVLMFPGYGASKDTLLQAAREFHSLGCAMWVVDPHGIGGSVHLATEELSAAQGVTLNHIPYKGSGEAMKDHLAGVVELFFDGPTTAISNAATGRVKRPWSTASATQESKPSPAS